MSRVLVVTLDTVAQRMAGPAIRAWEIASFLGAHHEVELVTFGACERSAATFTARRTTPSQFRDDVGRADVVIVQGYLMRAFPWLRAASQALVVDLYDPFHLESLEVERGKSHDQRASSTEKALAELTAQARRGDFFLCASAKQRDFWLGHLAATGRVNPATYDDDPSLRRLLDVVPFGITSEAPVRAAGALKGVVPGIGVDDHVIVWGGGVYNWFDPATVIRAVDRLRVTVPSVRLYFLGMKHPNPDVPETVAARGARALADELGLTGRFVFFNDDWVPYDRRADYLLDADIGVSAHFDHVETAFSFRTRILDYLWAGLPVVCTAGDAFGDLVAAENLGRAVPPEDPAALAAVLEELLTDPAERAAVAENVRHAAERYRWPVVLEPLARFCADPRRAADADRPLRAATFQDAGPLTRVREDATAAVRLLRDEGPAAVVRKVRARLGR
ncbi:glycosyltransferase family 4 protein [Georgenia sp. H159]|uniref:glycosyltransferase family 4 protein n=1 Tax=Georgenia sp. H159 TaxID=3076115 RepID=UPI002D793BF1|nr:glycosyltransferase family 4 protein [Georgenia sp. H159]